MDGDLLLCLSRHWGFRARSYPPRRYSCHRRSTPKRQNTGEFEGGHELFHAYCAPCHGVTARGDGPLASELKKAPADLTRIAARRGGVFPEHEIHEIIDGRRRMRGHSMPEWGRVFGRALPEQSEEMIRARMLEMVEYLKSIQEK